MSNKNPSFQEAFKANLSAQAKRATKKLYKLPLLSDQREVKT